MASQSEQQTGAQRQGPEQVSQRLRDARSLRVEATSADGSVHGAAAGGRLLELTLLHAAGDPDENLSGALLEVAQRALRGSNDAVADAARQAFDPGQPTGVTGSGA